MKSFSPTKAAFALTLLMAGSIGCKTSGGLSTSSSNSNNSNNKSDTSKTNSSTTRSTSTTTPPDIAGKYNVVGTNPNGAVYKGTLEVIKHGDVFQFRWNAGAQYDGVGVENGNGVAVGFAGGANGKGCGVGEYNIGSDGETEGKEGEWAR